MLAFRGDLGVKQELRDRLSRHMEAGTLQIGDTRWDGTSGSPLGVSVQSTDVAAYSDSFGYPRPLAGLLDLLTEMMGPNEAASTFVLDWIDQVEPGADLTQTPGKLMLHLLETAETGGGYDPLKHRLIDLHRRDLGDAAPARAEWVEVRQLIEQEIEAATDNYALLRLLEAASWPAGRGYTPLSTTVSAYLNLAGGQPDADWGEADSQKMQSFFEDLEKELRPRLEAGEELNFMAICKEREPHLAQRYFDYIDRSHACMEQHAAEVATVCLDCFRKAPVRALA